MAKPPESTKTSLRQKLTARASERWPQLARVNVRWHGQFACVSGQLPDGTTLPLTRLRYADSASTWGFAIYRASHDDYDKSLLPSGWAAGTPRKPSTAPVASTSATTPPGSPSRPDELTGAPTSILRLKFLGLFLLGYGYAGSFCYADRAD